MMHDDECGAVDEILGMGNGSTQSPKSGRIIRE
jgi:hypothetical protein